MRRTRLTSAKRSTGAFVALTSKDLRSTRYKSGGQATGVTAKPDSLSRERWELCRRGCSPGTDKCCVHTPFTHFPNSLTSRSRLLVCLFAVPSLRWNAMVALGGCVLQFNCVRTTGLAHTPCCCVRARPVVPCFCKCEKRKATPQKLRVNW